MKQFPQKITTCSNCGMNIYSDDITERTVGVEIYRCSKCDFESGHTISKSLEIPNIDQQVELKLYVPKDLSFEKLKSIKSLCPELEKLTILELKKTISGKELLTLGSFDGSFAREVIDQARKAHLDISIRVIQ